MNRKSHIDYWIASAKHDIKAMEDLVNSANYDWALFVGHMVIEKVLKARWLFDCTTETAIPPRTHLLDKLAKETLLNLDDATLIWLIQINDFNLETRYPDYKLDFYQRATRQFTEAQVIKIQELFQCILKSMR